MRNCDIVTTPSQSSSHRLRRSHSLARENILILFMECHFCVMPARLTASCLRPLSWLSQHIRLLFFGSRSSHTFYFACHIGQLCLMKSKEFNFTLVFSLLGSFIANVRLLT